MRLSQKGRGRALKQVWLASDAPILAGFKATRSDVAAELPPLVEDPTWFFDTELLVLAQCSGLRIHEVPVDWFDDPDSRVDVVGTALDDLRGVVRIRRGLASGRLPVAEVAALAPALGSTQTANLVALLVATVANTALNRRWTFGVRGGGVVRHQLQGLSLFALTWLLTAAALALLHTAVPNPSTALATLVVATATAASTAVRFVAMRTWMFRAPVTQGWTTSELVDDEGAGVVLEHHHARPVPVVDRTMADADQPLPHP